MRDPDVFNHTDHRPARQLWPVAVTLQTVGQMMAPENTRRPSAVSNVVSRGACGQSVSDPKRKCLYDITEDVVIFIEGWCV